MASVTYDPADANHATARCKLGATYWHEGKSYKYVQFVDAVTYVVGHVCVWANATGTAVTNDYAGGSAVSDLFPAGICMDVMTQNYYGFIQTSGDAEVVCDGSVAAGEYVVADGAGNTDGTADTMADGEEEQVFGIALEADSGTPATATVMLKGLI